MSEPDALSDIAGAQSALRRLGLDPRNPGPLTYALETNGHPVRQFFESRFPNRAAITKDVRNRAADTPILRPAAPIAYGTVGTAIDARIRLYFSVDEPRLAMLGAAGLGALIGPDLIFEFFDQLGERLDGLSVVGHQLDARDEAEICRYCYILALFEEVFRAGLHPGSPLLELSPKPTSAELLSLASQTAVDDLCQLSWKFYETQQSLLAKQVILGPLFAGSNDVGRADADLIADHCLIEIKSAVNPAKITKSSWPWQILGYVLLDYDDAFGIEEVALYLARQGLLILWPIEGYMAELAGRPSSLADARAALRELLA